MRAAASMAAPSQPQVKLVKTAVIAAALLVAACSARAGDALVLVSTAPATVETCRYAGGVVRIDEHGATVRVGAYPWCVSPYPGYYYRYGYVPPPAVAYGYYAVPAGIVVRGNGGTAAAYYNPYTGNAAAGRTVTAYDGATGTRAAGQRGGGYNAYTGDYAYGERGVVVNERTGAAAAGSRVTVGNARTGNEIEAARGAVYDPRTGRATTAAGVRGEKGGAARVGNQVVYGRNGNVHRATLPSSRPERRGR
jgi:hypothetical protein